MCFAFIHTNLPPSSPASTTANPRYSSLDLLGWDFDRTSSRQRHRNLLGMRSPSERTRKMRVLPQGSQSCLQVPHILKLAH